MLPTVVSKSWKLYHPALLRALKTLARRHCKPPFSEEVAPRAGATIDLRVMLNSYAAKLRSTARLLTTIGKATALPSGVIDDVRALNDSAWICRCLMDTSVNAGLMTDAAAEGFNQLPKLTTLLTSAQALVQKNEKKAKKAAAEAHRRQCGHAEAKPLTEKQLFEKVKQDASGRQEEDLFTDFLGGLDNAGGCVITT